MNHLLKTTKNQWLQITLNRPQKKNALDPSLIHELTEVFLNTQNDSQIQGIILNGAGSCFCAGADLHWMSSSSFDPSLLLNMFQTIEDHPRPVIVKAHGSIYGGGLGFLSVGDFVLADLHSQFCFSEVKIGIVPAIISPFVLKKVPYHKAKEWMMLASPFSVKEAKENHLVHFSGDHQEIQKKEDELIQKINSLDIQAVQRTKKLLKQILDLKTDQAQKISLEFLKERLRQPSIRQNLIQTLKKDSM